MKDWQAGYVRIASTFGYSPDDNQRTANVLSRLLRVRAFPILFASGNVSELLEVD